ncbi:MAG: o-succinylbenzoate synthase [Methanobacteriota archaeon]|nr:MAG: o-succinylbenzoate synthase [Euryarchaeota archaeon]
MQIIKYNIYRYSLTLKQPLPVKNQHITLREGYLLSFTDEAQHSGWGEVAPLPGLHQETLEEVYPILKKISQSFMQYRFPEQREEFLLSLAEVLQSIAQPSVRFGIEMALMELFCQRHHLLFQQLLFPGAQERIEINGLLDVKRVFEDNQPVEMFSKQFRVFKVKVGRSNLDEDIRMVRHLLEVLPKAARLRLDANKSWNLHQAITFGESLPQERVEYIEEPLSDVCDLPLLAKESTIPIALDESLTESHGFLPEGVKFLIMKPAVLGGWHSILKYKPLWQKNKLIPVISGSFLSGIGLRWEAAIAAAIMPAERAAGLSTFLWFKEDLLSSPIELQDGSLNVSALQKIPINYTKLNLLG